MSKIVYLKQFVLYIKTIMLQAILAVNAMKILFKIQMMRLYVKLNQFAQNFNTTS